MGKRSRPARAGGKASETRHGIARVISKAGACSRRQAEAMVREGRVDFDGRRVFDPEHPVASHQRGSVRVDGAPLVVADRCHVMVNKPRGVTVGTRDEQARDTIYRLLDGTGLPWLAPVGRLDRASEGLLLLANDPEWAARITDPASRLEKTYRVQVGRVPTEDDLAALRAGIEDDGEALHAQSIEFLRSGGKTAWLDFRLHGGRNRQIRRMLASRDLEVLRLIRVSIGSLELGPLAKGAWRRLEPGEVASLAPGTGR